jgi:hypothetical protein|tara:strand:+ start:227 stop:451 length:225 start_codon:yes stop_codon:yes gene_type:complete
MGMVQVTIKRVMVAAAKEEKEAKVVVAAVALGSVRIKAAALAAHVIRPPIAEIAATAAAEGAVRTGVVAHPRPR